jgi:O-antigen/teichoic acid export membrane protein
MTRGQRIVRNAAVLMAIQPLTWTLTLVFTVMVPRNVGPGEWGEWVIAFAVGNVARVLLDFGGNTVLFKGVSRYPDDSRRTLGAALTFRLCLMPVLAAAMIGFSWVAGYSAHTRLIVAIVAFSVGVGYVATPAIFALQALEKMHLTAMAGVLGGLVQTAGAVLLVKFLALGVVSVALLTLGTQVMSLVLHWVWVAKIVRVRMVVDLDLVRQLIREGLPYWAGDGVLTAYIWLDGLLLSLLGSTHENGWYGVATQLVSTLGFLPYAVTTAVFPALSRSLVTDGSEGAAVAGRSFRLLVTLSLPMTAGLALVSGNLVTTIYGAWFAPGGQALAVLALNLPPVFVATLVSGCLIAADRQLRWTWVMAAVCALNLVVNLFTIPFFHAYYGNGALGAALALLATDLVSGVAALVLLPASIRSAVSTALPSILGAALATLIMAAIVWPLRQMALPIPVLAGAAGFTVAALLLKVFPKDELQVVTGLVRKVVWRAGTRSASPAPRVAVAPAPIGDLDGVGQPDRTDEEVA